jgi:sulfite exporter TauE/SafE
MPIDWLALGAALLAGVLGGVHCAAMCGGIATGFSVTARGSPWVALEANLGRIGGYTVAGAIAGGFGHGIVEVARVDGLALGLRMLAGAVMILVALRLLDRRGRLAFLSQPGQRLWRVLRPLQLRLLPADTRLKRLGLAVLWGWLPCGLSTTLLVAAWLQAHALGGALLMLAFGLGTLPVMLPLTWSGARVGRWLQTRWRHAAAMLVLVAGMTTLTAPWLMQVPALHSLLGALGCSTLPA